MTKKAKVSLKSYYFVKYQGINIVLNLRLQVNKPMWLRVILSIQLEIGAQGKGRSQAANWKVTANSFNNILCFTYYKY